ncbi:MAG TPA: cell division protein [Lachnospiraceae bacterium]|nr:cell division protein [Lachnospiraceae bacterium]
MDRFKRGARKNQESFSDYTLLFIVLFLLAFGLVMLYSTSAYDANLTYNDSTYLFRKQIFSTLAGLVVLFIVSHLPYHLWERFAVIGYGVSVALVLLIIPFGIEANGAKRWLRVFGISLQPAEVAKLTMILFLAYLICKMGRNIRTMKGFLVVLGAAAPISGLIYVITRNLSSAIIIMGIAVVMLFVACPDYKRFIILGLIGIAGVAGIVFLIVKMSESGSVGSFRGERILAWLDPEAYASGKGFQTLQALYAIGSGGILGKGLGQSMQKLGFLPEAQNDMIFSIICEELGLFGAIAVLMMFILLIWRCMIIANNAPDLFGALLVVGVMGHIAIQVILNVAVVTNTIPNTGISLPFISYGGSSVMFLLAEIGIVFSVGRGIRLKDL